MIDQDNQLWQDIQAQADNLRHVIQHLYTHERQHLLAAAAELQNDRPVALIGIGSAAYLNMPAEVYLSKNGRFSATYNASDGYYSLLPALKKANVIINSRSGETVEVVKLSHSLAEARVPFVLITNEPESTAARLAKHVIWCDTRKDLLVSINIVTSMMVATLVTAAAAIGQMDQLYTGLQDFVPQFERAVTQASAQAERIYSFFHQARPLYLLYRGEAKGAAFCGRLVLEEVARWPGVAMDAAEFRQGPMEVVDDRFGSVLFVPQGVQGELNLALATDLLESGGKVMLVGDCHRDDRPGQLVFPLSGVHDTFLPVVGIVPLQMLAYKLALHQGYTPGEVRYISKVITTEAGIPKDA